MVLSARIVSHICLSNGEEHTDETHSRDLTNITTGFQKICVAFVFFAECFFFLLNKCVLKSMTLNVMEKHLKMYDVRG